MNLDEFRNNFLEELRISAEYEMNDIQSEFVKSVTNILKDAEEFDDFIEGYFEGIGEKGRKMVMDGYYFDPYDKSCVVLISNFSNKQELEKLYSVDVDKLYENMKNLVEFSINGYIQSKGFEESTSGYDFSKEIEERISEIVKFRFYIITDKLLTERLKNIRKDNISNKTVELNVWDINRLFLMYTSSLGKESIEVDLTNMKNGGIYSVSAVEDSEYSAYLSIIPGDILANMYIEYGSRLLEGNVRSFLSIKGKVNKEIRNTILNKPNMFFAYNNGIAATASQIEYVKDEKGLKITKIKDLQIINGGQTTASIANAVLQDKKDVSNVFVPMKLSVVNNDKAIEMIPKISRCANSQNKVDEADFFSNHPYHIRMEEYSRKIFAPAVDGNQYETIWFYERARGQYVQEQMKMTLGERKKYQFKNPKTQLLKKVDLAKYINTYECLPHIVSKGAQTSMRYFAERIDKEWEKTDTTFNEYYYKKVISLAIMFKNTESLIANQQWYKDIKAYRANIVTYSLSIIFYKIDELYPGKNIDFKKIWNFQKLYLELEKQLLKTTKEIFNFIIREDRLTLNVTEWCKKEACWERAKKENFELLSSFVDTLVDKKEQIEEAIDSKKDRKVINQLNAEIEVVKMGEDYWRIILDWAANRKLLTAIELDLLKVASSFIKTGRVPSTKQANLILQIREKLYGDGLPK